MTLKELKNSLYENENLDDYSIVFIGHLDEEDASPRFYIIRNFVVNDTAKTIDVHLI